MPATQETQQMEVLEHYYRIEDDHNHVILRGTFGCTTYGCYAIIAVVNLGARDWACYIGAAPKDYSEDDTMKIVAKHGNKMSKREAEIWFHMLFVSGLHYRE